jgi:hypothetical protein
MALAPGVIVVIVHAVGDGAADDRAHALDHPFAARIGVAPGKLHGGEIALADFGCDREHGGLDVDAVLAARLLEVLGRALMAEPARAEMHADPDEAVLVLEQVDIVVARSDGAELVARHRLEMARIGRAPRLVVVEQIMLDALRIDAADAEADVAADVGEDGPDPVVDRGALHVEANRHVAAADVVADAADRDMLLIGDHAADRLRVAQMPVGAQHAADHAADTHAARHLRLGARVMLAEDLELCHGTLLGLVGCRRSDVGCRRSG